jgi:hypothetical protein
LACPTVLSTLPDVPIEQMFQTEGQIIATEEYDILAASLNSTGAASKFVRVSCLLLAMLAVCVSATAGDAKPGDPIQATFDRVAKMSVADQQAWLVQLEQRAGRAAQLTLPPKEAAKHQKHTQSLLHQKKVTWQVLREVLADTETREKTVEAARVAKEQAAKAAETAKSQAAAAIRQQLAKALDTMKSQAAKVADSVVTEPPKQPIDAKLKMVDSPKPKAVEKAAKVEKVEKVAKKETTPATKPQSNAVTVNVDELEARIAACNLSLRELEASLSENGDWDASKLEPLLDRLKDLVVSHNDLGLYRSLIAKQQRSGLPALEPLKSAIAQLSAKVVEARAHANDPKFTTDDVERQAELTRLDAISHRLAELAGK